MKNLSIDKLNSHLFESIEMLKNQNDPIASENEKMDVETAKAISDISKVIIEGYKVKAQVIAMMRNTANPSNMRIAVSEAGILTEERSEQ